MPLIKKLRLAVKTSSDSQAGTDAEIFLVFILVDGCQIYRLPTLRQDMETGKLDLYDLAPDDGPSLSRIHSILLVNGMTGPNPSWKVLWVKLDVVDETGHAWRLVDAMLERWLDSTKPEGPIAWLPLCQPTVDLGEQDPIGPAAKSTHALR